MSEFIGKVTKGPFAPKSKSAHEAVYLESDGKSYVLRRQGGNPFYDPDLEKLVGKTVRCTGTVSDYVLMISDCKVLD